MERVAVRRDPLSDVDADAGDLPRRRHQPDPGEPVDPLRFELEGGQREDQCSLEVATIFLNVLPVPPQVEDRIANELARPVVRRLAAAVRLADLDVGALGRGARPLGAPPSVIAGGCSRKGKVSRAHRQRLRRPRVELSASRTGRAQLQDVCAVRLTTGRSHRTSAVPRVPAERCADRCLGHPRRRIVARRPGLLKSRRNRRADIDAVDATVVEPPPASRVSRGGEGSRSPRSASPGRSRFRRRRLGVRDRSIPVGVPLVGDLFGAKACGASRSRRRRPRRRASERSAARASVVCFAQLSSFWRRSRRSVRRARRHEPVVVRQRRVHDRADRDVLAELVLHDHGRLTTAYVRGSGLRLADDRRAVEVP